jgi:hypothetical protein
MLNQPCDPKDLTKTCLTTFAVLLHFGDKTKMLESLMKKIVDAKLSKPETTVEYLLSGEVFSPEITHQLLDFWRVSSLQTFAMNEDVEAKARMLIRFNNVKNIRQTGNRMRQSPKKQALKRLDA